MVDIWFRGSKRMTTRLAKVRRQVAYRMQGKGPPLVLVMGYRLNSMAWPASFIEQLARQFTIVTLDNRGTGRSDKPLNAVLLRIRRTRRPSNVRVASRRSGNRFVRFPAIYGPRRSRMVVDPAGSNLSHPYRLQYAFAASASKRHFLYCCRFRIVRLVRIVRRRSSCGLIECQLRVKVVTSSALIAMRGVKHAQRNRTQQARRSRRRRRF